MLRRVRDGGLEHCSELATATARWRPRSSVGMAWQGEEGSSARGSGSRRSLGVPRGAVGRSRRWPVALLGGGQRCSALARREAERERGGRRRLDWFANSEKFKGPTIKLK